MRNVLCAFKMRSGTTIYGNDSYHIYNAAAATVIWRAESNLEKKSKEDRLLQERIDREHEEIQEMLQRDVY